MIKLLSGSTLKDNFSLREIKQCLDLTQLYYLMAEHGHAQLNGYCCDDHCSKENARKQDASDQTLSVSFL